MNIKYIKHSIKVGLLFFAPYTAQASETMVVTASGFAQEFTLAPASISIITKKQLENQKVTDLADALENIEGVDVRGSTGKTGGMDISIRGMPAKYTLVLIDGRRQNDTSDVTPNGFGSMQTNFIPPITAIERIEVIKGPMSTLYGSDAMGGVINIITKKVSDEWRSAIKADYTLMQDRKSGDKGNISLYSSGPLIEDKLGLVLRGSIFNRQESLRTASDGSVLNTRGLNPVKATIYDIGGRINITPNASHDFWLDLSSSQQKYDNSNGQLGTLGISGYKKDIYLHREQAAIGYSGLYDLGTWESSLMYKQTENRGRVVPLGISNSGDDRKLIASDLIADSKFIMPIAEHNLSLGGQWWRSQIQDSILIAGAGKDKLQRTTYAAFVEDEWSILPSVMLTGGLRYDRNNKFGNHYSPRAYMVWSSTDNLTFKGGVSKGFRAPTLKELHNSINDVTRQGKDFMVGNPNLKPEVSTNYEVGFNYNNHQDYSLNTMIFLNRFTDKIASGDSVYNCNFTSNNRSNNCIAVPQAPKQEMFRQYINIDRVDTYGLELNTQYHITTTLALSMNYTYTKSEQKSGINKGKPLGSTPQHMASTKLDWTVNDTLASWVQVVYRGKADRFSSKYQNLSAINKAQYDELGDLKGYAIVNLGGQYQFSKSIRLSATLYNVLNKDFSRVSGYVDPKTGQTVYASFYAGDNGTIPEGRNLWLGLNIDF